MIQAVAVVSGVEAEEVAEEVRCFDFHEFFGLVISPTLRHFVNQAVGIVGDALGGVVVVLEGEAEHEVLQFVFNSPLSFTLVPS